MKTFVCTFLLIGVALAKKRTNLVLLFADDIGWGDLGANWKPNLHNTPNLNWLSEQGMRLTDFHSGAAVCTPSRASLLTGRLGLRTGVIRNFEPSSVAGLPLNETTVAEVLKKNNYNTGMIGKWHLGTTKKYHPMNRGFDFYDGIPYSNDMGCVDKLVYNIPMCKVCGSNYTKFCWGDLALPLYHNFEIVQQPVDLYKLSKDYSNAAEKFISSVANDTNPFFLYVAFTHMHVPLAPPTDSENVTASVYARTLRDLDNTVGNIISSLEKNEVYDNTLIWFTGDNGPWSEKCQYAGSPGPFAGAWLIDNFGGGSTAKATNWEAGHREPSFVVWQNIIKPNSVSSALTSALDIFPTLLSVAGAEMPHWRIYDGIDLTRLFMGEIDKGHDVLYHPNSGGTGVNGEIDTIRMGDYKAYWKTGGIKRDCLGRKAPIKKHSTPLIFNLAEDIAEKYPVTKQTDPSYNEIVLQFNDLRTKIYNNVKSDNTTVTDYRMDKSTDPCCNKADPLCRCNLAHHVSHSLHVSYYLPFTFSLSFLYSI